MGFHYAKTLCVVGKAICQVETSPAEWEKIFLKHASDEKILSKKKYKALKEYQERDSPVSNGLSI